MKKRFIPLMVLLVIFSLPSFAKTDTSKQPSSVTASKDADVDSDDFNDRSINLRVFIPQLAVGYLGGVWDMAISRVMSLGPIVHVFVFGKYSGYAFGLNVNYSLSGDLFSNGWILNPYAEYSRTNYRQPVDVNGFRPKRAAGVVGLQLMYQWLWDNGFDLMLGAGAEYAGEKIPVTSITDDDFHPTFEVTIGYVF